MAYNYSNYLITIMFLSLMNMALRVNYVYADNPLGQACFNSGLQHSPTFTLNLNILLHEFQAHLPDLHFHRNQITAPGNNDNVYMLSLCRGDTTIAQCKACVSAAAAKVPEVTSLCDIQQGEGGVTIWYDKCMIRYKDIPFFGKVDRSQDFYLWDVDLANNPREFMGKVKNLLRRLVRKCTKSSNLFANGPAAPYQGKTLHGMVQCSRDLSPDDCGFCLTSQILNLGMFCCNGTLGGRVVGNSCNLRYEIYPFLRNY